MTDPDTGLKTLQNGHVPVCRLGDAASVQNFCQRMLDDDQPRSRKRAHVDGLVDGNVPYLWRKLKEAGAGKRINVNWGTGRSYLENSAGAFYDLDSEAPGKVQILTSFGNEENRVEWSRILSEEADRTFASEKSWDNQVQVSLTEMVLHGTGPLFFDDGHTVFPRAIETGNLLVPNLAPSDIERWERCAILIDYYPPELYAFIENEGRASEVGWDVDFTKNVIQYAVDQKQPDQRTRPWEWYQTQLKTNSLDYVDNDDLICKLAHVFVKEFSGRVTHVIVERETNSTKGIKFLYKNVGRYDNFYQVIHPMYFDCGRGGYHHTVTGLGVKMYGAMETENRMICSLVDKANAPKILFKPTTQEAAEKFKLATFSDWGLLPPGTDAVQMPIQGFLTDGLAMFRTTSDLMRSNLSQYRQQVSPDRTGNPASATEIRRDAVQQSSLSNTTFSRHYVQKDLLYSEIVRRLCNLNTTDQRAKDFQDRCVKRLMPRECFGRIESVQAVRVVGQGSPFMRQTVTQTLLGIMGRLPENGQSNLLDDFIAAHAGQSAVSRYAPKTKMTAMAQDQKERATNQIAGMKIGMPPTMSPSQNPIVFAGLFIQASVQAINSIQQGANPQQVLAFVEIAGPAAMAHVKRLLNDPLRKEIGMMFQKQIKQLAAQVDKIKRMLQQQAQQQKKQGQKTQQVLSDIQLRNLETRAKIADKQVKTRAQLQDKAVRTRQSLAIQDATAASQIHLNRFRALSE